MDRDRADVAESDFIVDPALAIDALQAANASGAPHTIRYKLYSGMRFYYIEKES